MELVKTVKCKLQVDSQAREALQETIQRFADACNYILQVSKQHGTSNKVRLQHLCYHQVRTQFGLSANLTIRAIARVAAKMKLSRKPTRFWPSSVDYDQRIFRMRQVIADGMEQFEVTLTTTRGAMRFPLRIGNYQRSLLQGQSPTAATLCYNKPKRAFYIHIVLSKPMPAPRSGGQFVGVDLGINNLATCSNGLQFSGRQVMHIRRQYALKRAMLQSNASKGAQALLRRLSGRESRYMTWVNHTISRRIVDSLQPGDTIVLEELTHIRERIRVQREQRLIQHSWAFRQLQQFLTYKALERGINVVYVNPRDTSRSCPRCGHAAEANRMLQARFRCVSCGFQHNADAIAAENIARRAGSLGDGLPVTQPISACMASSMHS